MYYCIFWMRVISRRKLKDFYLSHPDAEQPLESWYREARNADWKTPAEIKAQFGTASVLKDKLVIFNIGGNKYRLVVRVLFPSHTIFVRFVGTHAEYDELDLEGL